MENRTIVRESTPEIGVARGEQTGSVILLWSEKILAAVLLVLAVPCLLIVALLIKFDSPGPILFSQPRLGRGGTHFDFYKFRTMHENSEIMLIDYLQANPEINQEWLTYAKLKGFDPRITRVGFWLRRFSLNELPQLLNVIRGDLCLIGPRPYLPSELPAMGELADIVLTVRPGITGLWQVSGRNEIPFSDRVKLDAWYVEHRNLKLDLLILLRTIPAVVLQRGAY